jgi:hypothetical protein
MQDGFILVFTRVVERNGGRGVEKENKAGNGNARGRVARLISGYKIKELTFIFVHLFPRYPSHHTLRDLKAALRFLT